MANILLMNFMNGMGGAYIEENSNYYVWSVMQHGSTAKRRNRPSGKH